MNSPTNHAPALIPSYAANVYNSRIETLESINSLTYTDLATVGPSITVTTGTSVIVIFGCAAAWSGSGFNFYVSIAVSGATTIAASDDSSAQMSSEGNQFSENLLMAIKLTGLTPGSNTFTMKYRVNGQTWNCDRRQLTVVVL